MKNRALALANESDMREITGGVRLPFPRLYLEGKKEKGEEMPSKKRSS